MSFDSQQQTQEFKRKVKLLEQALKLVEESYDDLGELYSLLENNQSLLDDNFIQVLKTWASNKFETVEFKETQQIGRNLANFGQVIFNFSKGEEKINTEIAIAAYWESLKVLTEEDFPEKWANIQNNLANVYTWRIRGEKVENIEKAIKAYQDALKVFIEDKYRDEWARIQHNLGIAYRNRIRGDENKNIDQAIGYYKSALKIRKKQKYPVEWATTQLGLAHAYGSKKDEDRNKTKKNIKKAIQACKLALKVFSKEDYPYEWAETHNCLSLAYRDKIAVDETDKTKDFQDFEEAITLLESALEVFSKENYREAFARIQNNLGTIYRRRIKGEKVENLQKSIIAYESALEVYTFDAFPYYHLEVLFNLGSCHLFANNLIKAYEAFKTSIDIIELFRNEIVSRLVKDENKEIEFLPEKETDKQKLAENWNILYQHMVEVCLKLNQTTEAIEYAERSKTRNLVELILSRDFESIFPSEVASQLKEIQNEIQESQAKIQDGRAKDPEIIAQHLQQLRQDRNQLQDRYLTIGSGFNFEQFQNNLDDQTGIIYWYISNTELETFIITRDSLDRLRFPNSGDNLKALDDCFDDYQESYSSNKNQWIKDLNSDKDSLLSRLARILCIDQILKHQTLQQCQRLIIIPHRYLHLLPLHALPLVGGEFLCERFPKGVGYGPSCQLLQLAQKRGQNRREFNSLFAVEASTSTKSLLGSKLEINSIRQHFTPENTVIITGNQVSLSYLDQRMADLSSAHCVHFSCHGKFEPETPLKSALKLRSCEDERDEQVDLTLAKIFEKLKLEQCRLVTFSSCETGIIDDENISDEYIGLSSGFLYAGTATVVSTLGTVDPVATALLLKKFYENLKKVSLLESGNIAYALTQAQIWLKTLPSNQLESKEFKLLLDEVFCDQSVERKKFEDSLCAAINRGKSSEQPYPFANPYYWGYFIATGF